MLMSSRDHVSRLSTIKTLPRTAHMPKVQMEDCAHFLNLKKTEKTNISDIIYTNFCSLINMFC